MASSRAQSHVRQARVWQGDTTKYVLVGSLTACYGLTSSKTTASSACSTQQHSRQICYNLTTGMVLARSLYLLKIDIGQLVRPTPYYSRLYLNACHDETARRRAPKSSVPPCLSKKIVPAFHYPPIDPVSGHPHPSGLDSLPKRTAPCRPPSASGGWWSSKLSDLPRLAVR